MPDFELRTHAAARVRLSQWIGRRLLLIFIQPDCSYSRALLPTLSSYASDLSPDRPLPVIISTGREAENRRLAQEYGIRCPLLLQDGVEAARGYGISGTPSSYVIDELGNVSGGLQIGVAGVLSQLGVTPAGSLLHGGCSAHTAPYFPVNHRLQYLLQQRQGTIGSPAGGPLRQQGGEKLESAGSAPLVSVILTTRDRPRLLPIALECYRRQTYAPRELIVVDDGTQFPADPHAIEASGGHVVRVEEGMTLGAKLNRGAQEACGRFCQKWDDDDWYAPRFLETMVCALLRNSQATGTPGVAFLTLPLLFDLARWRILDWKDDDPCGSTLLFEREQWTRTPFQNVRHWDDFWFLVDQMERGVAPVSVDAGELYVIVRHDTLSGERDHSWREWGPGRSMEAYLQGLSAPSRNPASVLPSWALSRYVELRSATPQPTSP